MVEFNGYLSGSAEKRFFIKARNYAQTFLLFGTVFALPMAWMLGKYMHTWIPVIVLCVMLPLIPLLVRIPKSKKEKVSITPRRIYIEDELIICVADAYEECKNVSDVEKVLDRGEYYELIFPFGKLSEKFICQKSLLVKGSLEEFESLFEEKIVKR